MKLEKIISKLEERPVGSVADRKYFSVLILFTETDGNVNLLFERRSSKMKTQPGDVCFPGGRIEEGETALECALRETYEETGICPEDVKVIGQFDTMYEIAGITIYTFVGAIDCEILEKLDLNPSEVEEVFTVPLDFFIQTEPVIFNSEIVQKVDGFPYEEMGISADYKWRKGKNIIPIYKYNGKVIWGITGRIVKRLAECLK